MDAPEVGKAIHHAAGLLEAASMASMYADRWRAGGARCHRRVAAALDQLADFLRAGAASTRANAERGEPSGGKP